MEDLKLSVQSGDTGLTGNLYCGLHEFWEMAFLLHFLGSDKCFVDVGANLGAYTLLASGAVQARTFSIEPVPSTFERLRQNVALNALEDRVALLNVGVSGRDGQLRFSDGEDSSVNRVVDKSQSGIDLPVRTLDQLLQGESPSLVKVDVEGHELPLLDGAVQLLTRCPAWLIETLEHRAEIMEVFLESGFTPYAYDPFNRALVDASAGQQNTLFVRDRSAVESICKEAQLRSIHGVRF
ncbi:MAG: FkbM family methyltransferase [Pseudomonadales bacterium]|nr:FkbM family methyltransferase [Pseudomonadales bacterium]